MTHAPLLLSIVLIGLAIALILFSLLYRLGVYA